MGLFKKVKDSVMAPDELRQSGIEGTATLVSQKKTLATEGPHDTPVYKAKILVTVQDGEPYETEAKVKGGLKPDMTYRVFADPKDSERVLVDTAGMARDRIADKLSQATGQAVSGEPDSIQDAIAQLQRNAQTWGKGGGSKLG